MKTSTTKKVTAFAAMALCVSSAFAQLTTRVNDSTVVKYGARPKAGDMAFVLGTDLASGGALAQLFSGNSLKSGDILMYKNYLSDNLVFRGGIRLHNQNSTFKGTGLDSAGHYDPNTVMGGMANFSEIQTKTVNRLWEIVPGIEKHFLGSNFFDAYMGGDLYLGFGSDKTTTNIDYRNGDKHYVTRKTNATSVGLGFVSGFNVFLGHLPASIGLEYGLSAKWLFGGATRVKEDHVVAGSTNLTYSADYKEDGVTNAKYSKLSARDFNMDSNQNVRLVLHIYFSK